jgi:hypothetical protein
VRAFILSARIGRDDIKPVNIDVPATQFVARKNLNTPDRRQISQFYPAKSADGRIIENGALIWISLEPKPNNLVIRGKLNAVRSPYKGYRCVFVRTEEGLPRRKMDRWSVR